MNWTASSAAIDGQTIYRAPALTSIDHESSIVTVHYKEAIKPASAYIQIGGGSYTLSSADIQTMAGQMVAGSEQVIAVELAKEVPGVIIS